MSENSDIRRKDQSLQIKCIDVLRSARNILLQKKDEFDELKRSVEKLEDALFSADNKKPGLLLECYLDLVFVMKEMEKSTSTLNAPKRPIALQIATANSVLPIHLEWNYHDPNSLFLIEYANFEEANKPAWRAFSETRSMSFTVRGLEKGQAYWFRISAMADVV